MAFSRSQFVFRHGGKPFADGYWKEQGDHLGAGCFGSVTRARHAKTGQPVAVKAVPRQDARTRAAVAKEANVLALLDHPHIVKLYETFDDGESVYFVMEDCEGGSLLQHAQQRSFSERQTATIMQQILRAVNYWQGLDLSHNDLCMRNVMLKDDIAKEPWLIKVIDFGCVELTQTPHGEANARRGDLLNCGIIVRNLICGYAGGEDASVSVASKSLPLSVSDSMSTVSSPPKPQKYLFPELWDKVSADCLQFHGLLVVRDPSKRVKSKDALLHPWIQQHCSHPGPASEEVAQKLLVNIERLRHASLLKKAALMQITEALDEEALRPLRDAFLSLDADNDGFISVADMRNALIVTPDPLDETQLQDTVKQLDVDHDSSLVEYSAFIVASLEQAHIEAGSLRALTYFNRGKSKLNSASLMEFFHSKLPGERLCASEMVTAARVKSTPGDGRVLNVSSFRSMLLQQSTRKESLRDYLRFGPARAAANMGNEDERKKLVYRKVLQAAKKKISARILREIRESFASSEEPRSMVAGSSENPSSGADFAGWNSSGSDSDTDSGEGSDF
mmetsp:Transcript_66858/g.160039  ORF Transcript_66858/g.160039 Transcript_66858/m.160039 type:complete len:562 (-) Transcript_66858:27-1712(-)